MDYVEIPENNHNDFYSGLIDVCERFKRGDLPNEDDLPESSENLIALLSWLKYIGQDVALYLSTRKSHFSEKTLRDSDSRPLVPDMDSSQNSEMVSVLDLADGKQSYRIINFTYPSDGSQVAEQVDKNFSVSLEPLPEGSIWYFTNGRSALLINETIISGDNLFASRWSMYAVENLDELSVYVGSANTIGVKSSINDTDLLRISAIVSNRNRFCLGFVDEFYDPDSLDQAYRMKAKCFYRKGRMEIIDGSQDVYASVQTLLHSATISTEFDLDLMYLIYRKYLELEDWDSLSGFWYDAIGILVHNRVTRRVVAEVNFEGKNRLRRNIIHDIQDFSKREFDANGIYSESLILFIRELVKRYPRLLERRQGISFRRNPHGFEYERGPVDDRLMSMEGVGEANFG